MEDVLRGLPAVSVSGNFFRDISLQWITSPLSIAGARIFGGRFNPPATLADSPFGLLYTAADPITCLYECRHIFRGKTVPTQPYGVVTFSVETDSILDLTDPKVAFALELDFKALTDPDNRADLNDLGKLTYLQQIGAAAYKSGRFHGLKAPSHYSDVTNGVCLNFLPASVQSVSILDVIGVLGRLRFDPPFAP